MKPPKYYSSIILRFRSWDRFLLRFADKYDLAHINPESMKRIRECMVYFICIRPIVSIMPETFKKQGGHYEFTLQYRISGKEKLLPVKFPKEIKLDFGGKVKVSEYPHTAIHSYNANNELVSDFLLANMIHLLEGVPDELADLEVVYIGKGTADCALDRLDQHSTLEKILANVLKKEPNKEVALFLLKYKMQRDVMRPEVAMADLAEIRGAEAESHYQKLLEYAPDNEEQAKIVEALLIDHFKTSEYNTHYVNGLSKDLAVLKNVYELNFDAIIAEVDTENIGGVRLYSRIIPPKYHHDAVLDIRREEGRFSLFGPRL